MSPYFVSPDGSSTGLATKSDPMTLDSAMSKVKDSEEIICMDGIYYHDNGVYLGTKDGKNIVIRADDGARPIFTRSDDTPPYVVRRKNCTVKGLWFGGGRRPADLTSSKSIPCEAGGSFEDCTFWNYYQCIVNGGDTHSSIYRRNRFVRCGFGDLYHALYIANQNATKESDGVLTEENIFVGGIGGHNVHYYHNPAYGVVRYNLMCDGYHGMALQCDIRGPLYGYRNIVWRMSNNPLYIDMVIGECNNNVFRDCASVDQIGVDIQDNNYFMNTPTAGTNPVVWQETDVIKNFGTDSANIDAAIAALESAFAQTVQQIHDDATIETHFATLKGVIDTWKLQ